MATASNEVKQMVRTLANVTNQESGIDLAANVDYELAQYLNRGYELNKVVSLGSAKVGSEEFPRVLYVLVKYAE